MATSAHPPPPSPEEQDLLLRCTKKHKSDESDATLPDQHAFPVLEDSLDCSMNADPSDPLLTASAPTALATVWNSRSFAEVVRTHRHGLAFYTGEDEEEKYAGVDELFLSEALMHTDNTPTPSEPTVHISKEKYTSLFKPWRGALILKLLGKTVGFRALEQWLRDLWCLDNGFQLIDLEDGYFMARFFTRADYLFVLEEGPWIVFGHYLTVTKWRPNFCPDTDKIKSTLAWVRFPRLPLELFEEEILSEMGEAVGRVSRVDHTSLTSERGKYDRVCVEVDLNKPLLPAINILGRTQPIEYEGLHLICFECGMYGHRMDACPKVPCAQSPPPPPVVSPVIPPNRTSPYGPWMLPKNYRRRPPPARQPSPAHSNETRSALVGPAPQVARPGPAQGHKPALPVPPAAGPSIPTSSRFSALVGLEEDSQPAQSIAHLKQQIQALPPPGARNPLGSAHAGHAGWPRAHISARSAPLLAPGSARPAGGSSAHRPNPGPIARPTRQPLQDAPHPPLQQPLSPGQVVVSPDPLLRSSTPPPVPHPHTSAGSVKDHPPDHFRQQSYLDVTRGSATR